MILYITAIILFGASIFFLTNFIEMWKKGRLARTSFLEIEKRAFESIFVKWLLPLIESLAHLPFVRGGSGWGRFCRGSGRGRYAAYLSTSLIKAGLSEKLRKEEFIAYQMLMAIIFALLVVLFPFGTSYSSLFLGMLLGFFYPLLWLISLKKRRHAEITYTLPLVLDLLTLSVEAGLDFVSAVARIVEKSGDSIVVSELKRMLGQMKLGKGRADALTEFKLRLSHPSVDSFVSMLIQAERLGASIGPILKAHAEKLRSDRFQQAEKAGVVAAQKVLVPLIFCIMPAVFIIVFGPLVVMWKTGVFERMFQ